MIQEGSEPEHQANEMQGTLSRAHMDRDTWNLLEESNKKAWDGLLDKAKIRSLDTISMKAKSVHPKAPKPTRLRPRNTT